MTLIITSSSQWELVSWWIRRDLLFENEQKSQIERSRSFQWGEEKKCDKNLKWVNMHFWWNICSVAATEAFWIILYIFFNLQIENKLQKQMSFVISVGLLNNLWNLKFKFYRIIFCWLKLIFHWSEKLLSLFPLCWSSLFLSLFMFSSVPPGNSINHRALHQVWKWNQSLLFFTSNNKNKLTTLNLLDYGATLVANCNC